MNETTWNCMIAAAIVLVIGMFLAGFIFYISGLQYFPSRLADIYREDQISLTVPGSKEVQLNRTGAYGIYYQYSLLTASADPIQNPPDLTCTLKSESGQLLEGVADYKPTNRYWSKIGGGPATLIQSITIDDPGEYTFECVKQDDNSVPDVLVSLGPNYTWEFIRLVLKNGVAVLGIILSLFSSVFLSLILVGAGIVEKKNLRWPTKGE